MESLAQAEMLGTLRGVAVTRELEFDAAALSGMNDVDNEAVFKNVNYVQLVLKYRWWLVFGGCAGLLMGGLLYVRSGPEYEATAQILVSKKDSVPIREEMRMLSDFGERSEHIALILSPLIINRAVELGHLENLPAFRGSPKEEIVQDVISDLKVKRSSGQDRSYTNVLTITYPSRRPEDAKAVVDSVIAAYHLYLDENRNEKSNEVLSVTKKALTDVEAKLHVKEQEYHAFRDSAPLQWKAPVGGSSADGQKTTNVHQERVVAAEEQRRLNLLRNALLQSRLKAIEASLADGQPRDGLEVLIRRFMAQDGPSGAETQQQQQDIAIFENRLLPLILEEKQLTRDYGPDHPDVKKVRELIATTLDFYRRQGIHLPEERRQQKANGTAPEQVDFVALYASSLRQELAELAIRDQQLALLVSDESTKAKDLARLQAKDESMNAELMRLRDLWGQLVTQVNQVGIEREGNGYVLKQIAPVKEELSIKRVLKFLGGGGVFGVFAIAGLCLLRELRDLRIKTVSELRRATSQPLLGTIGKFTTDTDPQALRQGVHPSLRYLLAPRSMEAENFRSLRTTIGVTLADAGGKVLLVTSPESGDGKSTTIANLAIALSQSGKRVLLVDADLRRPTLHQLFRVPLDVGLVDVLQGDIEGLNAIRDTFVENLRLLPSGRPPANPAELISRPRLAHFLREVRDEYDIVLVDSPPLLAVSDPSAMAHQADGVLLVVRMSKTSLITARRLRDLVMTQGMKIVGMVANDTALDDTNAYAASDRYYREYEVGSPSTTPLVGAGAP